MFVSCRHSAPNEAYKNESSIENGKNKINPDGIKTTTSLIVVILVLLILSGLTLFLVYKKRKKRKGNLMSLCAVLF